MARNIHGDPGWDNGSGSLDYVLQMQCNTLLQTLSRVVAYLEVTLIVVLIEQIYLQDLLQCKSSFRQPCF